MQTVRVARWIAAAAAVGVACLTPRSQAVTASAAPADQRPDVVLIVVDALRADRLALYGYSRPTTPWLTAHRNRLGWFTDAVTDATQTVPAIASLFTGVRPSDHGIQFDTIGSYFPPYGASPRLDAPHKTMAEEFRESGYYTIGVVGNPWLMESTRFSRGFARFDDWKVWDRKGVNDDAAMIQAGGDELMAPSDQPRFLWVHLMSVHNPYDKGHRSLVRQEGTDRYVNGPASPSPGDLAFMSDLYDSNVAYADGLVGGLIDRLAFRPKQRPAVVCIVGDHGDELLEHGGFGHGTTLFHELARVPVVVWGPAYVRRPGPSARPIQLSGVRGMVMALAGKGESPLADVVTGRAKGPPAAARDVRSIELNNEKAVYEAPWKYIVTKSPFRERLFNLADDPAEKADRAAGEPGVLARLRDAARKLWPDVSYPN
jgi:arylsulfatase A-like enzyme